MWRSPCREGRRDSPRALLGFENQSLMRQRLLLQILTLCAVAMALALLALASTSRLQAQQKTSAGSPAPPAAKPQPVPFSHKIHTQFIQECQDCHQIASDGWTMGYPDEGKCMTCHATVKTESPAIKKLAEYAARKKPVPWVQIYEVPDYVYFSHRRHVKKAGLDCAACHGPVRERDVITKEKSTSMSACINCHKEKGTPTGCRTCHDTV